MSRRRLAVVAGLAAAVVVRAAWWEPRRTLLRERDLVVPNWPERLDGLRIALVSDLHTGAPYVDEARVERIVAAVQAAAPDVVALLGDFVDATVAGALLVSPQAVAQRVARLRAPVGVAAVLGNHDWDHTGEGMARALRAAGVTLLENDAVCLEARGGPLWLAGLADASTRRPSVHEALQDVPADDPVIVLSHDPDAFPRVPARVALTVSGHTHGGQVDLPGLAARTIPSRFGARYKGGHVVEDGRHLFVSRGIGTSRLPIRLLAAPEVPVLRLLTSR